MANEVKWTNRALYEYDKLVSYLFNEWGENIAGRVINEINQTIVRIAKSPEQFPVFIKKKELRRCVASPQASIFFYVKNNVIEILSIFDNRQNPRKLKL
jgi:plasmid stabilization system protein ParE